MRRVVIESPLKGANAEEYARNRRYAIACWHDSRLRGEAPYASHIFIAQPGLLDDTIPEERESGIAIGLEWAAAAELRAFYVDLGMSEGMQRSKAAAKQPTETRRLPPDVLREVLADRAAAGQAGQGREGVG